MPLLRNGRAAVARRGGMYREILRQIEREGYGARPGRAVVRAAAQARSSPRGVGPARSVLLPGRG